MTNEKFFKDPFKSFTDYRKILLIKFVIKKDMVSLEDFGFVKSDIEHLNLKFKKFIRRN